MTQPAASLQPRSTHSLYAWFYCTSRHTRLHLCSVSDDQGRENVTGFVFLWLYVWDHFYLLDSDRLWLKVTGATIWFIVIYCSTIHTTIYWVFFPQYFINIFLLLLHLFRCISGGWPSAVFTSTHTCSKSWKSLCCTDQVQHLSPKTTSTPPSCESCGSEKEEVEKQKWSQDYNQVIQARVRTTRSFMVKSRRKNKVKWPQGGRIVERRT